MLHVSDLLEEMFVYLLKILDYRFSEKKPEKFNSLLHYPVRLLISHTMHATLPSKMQRVTHTFSTVQQDCLTLKM